MAMLPPLNPAPRKPRGMAFEAKTSTESDGHDASVLVVRHADDPHGLRAPIHRLHEDILGVRVLAFGGECEPRPVGRPHRRVPAPSMVNRVNVPKPEVVDRGVAVGAAGRPERKAIERPSGEKRA